MLGRSLPRVAARAFARQPVGKSTVRSHHLMSNPLSLAEKGNRFDITPICGENGFC